jgi:hypothetical protein
MVTAAAVFKTLSPDREEFARDVDFLVTMSCGDRCPFVPGLKVEDWPLPDPKGHAQDKVALYTRPNSRPNRQSL